MIKYIISFCFILLLYYDFFIMFGLFQQEHYNVKKYLKHTLNYYISNISTIITLILFIPTLLFNLSGAWYYGVMILFLQLGVINFLKPLLVKLKFTKRTFRVIITLSILLFIMLLLFKGNILVYNTFLFAVPLLILLIYYLLWPLEELIKKYYLHSAKKKLQEASPITIGITGSYGKTSVKNFVASLVDKAYISVKTPASYNTLMGITKTINTSVNNLTEVFISEMGATKKGEIKELTDFVAPSIAVITEIGPQHLETFKSLSCIQDTKFEIVESPNLKCLVLNIDNKYIREYEKYISKEKIASGLKIIKVSTDNKNADLYMEHYDENTYKVYYNGAFLMMLTINLLGRHNLMNILESVAVALYLKIDPKDIKDAVEKIESVPHRLSVNYDGCYRIIDDAFNSNVKGFKGALEVLRKETNFKVIITPGIVDGGSYLERINSSLIIDLMNSCDLILLIKNEASKIIELGLKTADYHRYLVFDSFKEAYAYLKKTYPSTSMTILIENDLPDSFLRR